MERGKKARDPSKEPPVNGTFFSTMLGVTSEAYADSLGKFMRSDPDAILHKGKKVSPQHQSM